MIQDLNEALFGEKKINPEIIHPGAPSPDVLRTHGTYAPWYMSKLFQFGLGETLSTNAPPLEMIKDARDVFGANTSPYTFNEVIKGKVFIVGYTYQPEISTVELMIGNYRKRPLRARVLTEFETEEECRVGELDISCCDKCLHMSATEAADGGFLRAGLKIKSHMLVVKMSNGKLLLYSPVKVDNIELSPWLIKNGGVGAIIVPSASHTLFAKNVQDHFPHAKLIASQVGTMKLRKMGARVDFEYTSDEGLSATRRALGSLGIVFFRLDGCTNQECCVVHEASNVLLTCELLYTGSQDETFGGVTSEQWKNDYDETVWFERSFVRQSFTKKFASGMVPVYRWQSWHDPEFPIWPRPPPGSMTAFGTALYKILQLPIKHVLATHVAYPIKGESGIALIKKSWQWTFQ